MKRLYNIQTEIIRAVAFVRFNRPGELSVAVICIGATKSQTILLLLFIEKHTEPDIMKLNDNNTLILY